MPSYVHRLARREDLPVIVDIYNSTIASREVTADTEPVTVAVARSLVPRPYARAPAAVGDPRCRRHLRESGSDRLDVLLEFLRPSGLFGHGRAVDLYRRSLARQGPGAYCLEQAMAFAPQSRCIPCSGLSSGTTCRAWRCSASTASRPGRNFPRGEPGRGRARPDHPGQTGGVMI
jgi:hypothetical protein